jgi:mannose-6-phosphate isomerase-like protein (cupin superfamily)
MTYLPTGTVIDKDALVPLLHPGEVRLVLGGGEPLSAPGSVIFELLDGYLSLEEAGWTALEVVMADEGSGTRLLQIRHPGSPAGGVSTVIRARLGTGRAGIDELAVFTPLASSLVPVGAREHDVTTPAAAGVSFFGLSPEKKVTKHWGSEHWLHADGDSYGFKVIRIKAGKRTSLQFHREKHETYFVLSGRAALHCRDADGRPHVVDFPAGHVARVVPGAVHRVEARTDVVLVEASTADDGSDNVRIEDDAGRADGRIDEEYSAAGGRS